MNKFFSLIITSLLAISCGDKPATVDPFLSLNPSSLSFDYAGGAQNVTITSDQKPSYIHNEKWLSLSLSSGASQTYTLKVEAQPNTGTTERSASVTILGNRKKEVLTITQGVQSVELIVDKDAVELDGLMGQASINVQSGIDPQVASSEAWCGPVMGALSADKTGELVIKSTVNMSGSDRTATVKVTAGSQEKTIKVTQKAVVVETASCDALTPESFAKQFVNGWNLGNQLDSFNGEKVGETLWGNSEATQATFDAVKAAGFKSVRIPVTYLEKIGAAPIYEIDAKYLNRVAEVVGYAKNAGLNVIINIHHDGADSQHWLNIKEAYKSSEKNEAIKAEIAQVWGQIALKFKDEGDYLMFESFNEIHDGGWGWANSQKGYVSYEKYANTLNEWNQVFVDVVRTTGGNNATRILGVPGACASPNFAIAALKVPTDKTSANRIAVSVHYYGYGNYQLQCTYSQWGHTADPAKTEKADNEESTKWQINEVKKTFCDNGIPAYFGETGCSSRTDAVEQAFHKYYLEYTWKCIHDAGMVPFLWDNGAKNNGKECHGYINHGTGNFMNNYMKGCVEAIIRASTETDPSYTLESVYNSAPSAN